MQIKKLGFGCMRLPLMDANDSASIDMDTLKQMVDAFMKEGFTYFDTAYPYHKGMSETAVREALVKRYERESFTLANKLPTWEIKKFDDQERIFSEQLKKCGVDYFDYYLLHNLTIDNYKTVQTFDSFAFVAEKKKTGRIRQIGFSYHDNADLLDEILTAHPETEFVQLQINYLDWRSESIQSKKCYDVARKHGKPVVVMEPVKGGILAKLPEEAVDLLKKHHADMSIPSWAIRFAASLEGVITVLSGMSNMEQLRDNTSYMSHFQPFVQDEYDIVQQVVSIINENIAIPCTACGYCVEGCPQNIAIPKYFELYNAKKQFGATISATLLEIYYNNYTNIYGKSSDCIACRRCEDHCPQHIEISKSLRDVAAVFEK